MDLLWRENMLGYKRILIATDLSPQGKKTLEGALSMSKDSGADVYIIHVLERSPISYGGEFSIPMDTNVEQTIEAQALAMLQQIAEKYKVDENHLHLGNGSVKTEVTTFAKKVKADLIVVGSHGGGTIGVLLGSRANAILHQAQCDVWVFKENK
jgi:universal stress protein A